MIANRYYAPFLLSGLLLGVGSTAAHAESDLPPGIASPAAMPTQVDSKTINYQLDSVKLKPAEAVAFVMVETMSFMQGQECVDRVKVPCTMDQLRKGIALPDDAHTERLKFDPDTDPNYAYAMTTTAQGWEIHANPKKPGLIGFYLSSPTGADPDMFKHKTSLFYNRKGAATATDEKSANYGVSGGMFSMH